MNLKNTLALGIFALLGAKNAANAQYTFFTTDTTVSDAVSIHYAIVGYASGTFNNFQAPASPTINFVNSGSVISSLYAYNSSAVNITDGNAPYLAAYDRSIVNFSGGVGGYITAFNSSLVYVRGGRLDHNLIATNNSVINLSGGNVNGVLSVEGNGAMNIMGSNLAALLVNPNFGSNASLYTLSGVLADGTPLNNKTLDVINGTGASFRLFNTAAVPEPSSLTLFVGLITFSAGVLRKRRK